MCQPLPVGDFVFEQVDSWLNNDGTPNVEKIMNLKVEDVKITRHDFSCLGLK